MPAIRKLSGLWRGRLVDVQGFEGDLEINMRAGSAGQLSGTFDVAIGATHSTIRRQGTIEGKVSGQELRLALIGRDLPVKFELVGEVLNLRDGGLGLKGVYEVSAKGFSPLQGGVVSAAKDQKLEVDIATRRAAG